MTMTGSPLGQRLPGGGLRDARRRRVRGGDVPRSEAGAPGRCSCQDERGGGRQGVPRIQRAQDVRSGDPLPIYLRAIGVCSFKCQTESLTEGPFCSAGSSPARPATILAGSSATPSTSRGCTRRRPRLNKPAHCIHIPPLPPACISQCTSLSTHLNPGMELALLRQPDSPGHRSPVPP